MTGNKINEIIELINQQKTYIFNLKAQFEIALGDGFLDNSKSSIHNHISLMDDMVEKINVLNEEIHIYLCKIAS